MNLASSSYYYKPKTDVDPEEYEMAIQQTKTADLAPLKSR